MSTDIGNRVAQGRRSWLLAVVVGGISGSLVGAVVAVNVVIYAGIERGYEASIPEVFRESVLIGALVVAILVAGPAVDGPATPALAHVRLCPRLIRRRSQFA